MPAAIAAFAEVDPDLMTAVMASAQCRPLLADVPGTGCRRIAEPLAHLAYAVRYSRRPRVRTRPDAAEDPGC